MKDRISTKILENGAIRYGIYDEAGNLLRYEYIRPEDEPTQAGDPVCKATLLDDDTQAIYGFSDEDAVPNKAFQKLLIGDKYAFAITVKTPRGNPIAGVTVGGVSAISGEAAVTDENGRVVGVSESFAVSLSIVSPYIDLTNWSSSIMASGIVTSVNIVLPAAGDTSKTLLTSANFKFSPDVAEADFCIVGGGGGGASPTSSTFAIGGPGGGGGYVSNLLNYIRNETDEVYTFTCGAGGTGATAVNNQNGGNGGTSSLSINGVSALTATGGNGGKYPNEQGNGIGGTGNGSGGNSSLGTSNAGGNGTVSLFNEGAIFPGGGGGAGGSDAYTNQYGVGGQSYGGRGGYYAGSGSSHTGQSGKGPGGGGGGGAKVSSNYQAGNGAGGALYVRWRYAA